MYALSSRSRSRLQGVHPLLVKVITRAIQITSIDFGVLEGVRTQELQDEYYDRHDGTTNTRDSYHIPRGDYHAHAVDLYAWVEGEVSWKHEDFRYVLQACFTAAIELGVQIQAGGLWRDPQDSPHIQLNSDYHPRS